MRNTIKVMNRRFYRIFLCLFVMNFLYAPVFAASSSNELDQVKEALVEVAMTRGVSVISNAYIDADGKLVESSFYRSGASLRGVRISSLFDDEPYVAKPLFFDTAINKNLGCEEIAPHKYRKAVSVEISLEALETDSDRQLVALASSLNSYIEAAAYEAIEKNSDYYSLPVISRKNFVANQYEEALMPRSNDPRNTNLIFKIEVIAVKKNNFTTGVIVERSKSVASNTRAWLSSQIGTGRFSNINSSINSSNNNSTDIDIRISIQNSSNLQNDSINILLEEVLKFRFDGNEKNLYIRESLREKFSDIVNFKSSKENAGDLFAANWSVIFGPFIDKSIAQINCDVEELKVYRPLEMADRTLRLNQGALANVSIGDRFILSTSNFSSPQNSISSDQLDKLAIAEVVSSSQYSADLIVVEGPEQDDLFLSAIPF